MHTDWAILFHACMHAYICGFSGYMHACHLCCTLSLSHSAAACCVRCAGAQERKNLALSLKDTRSVVGKLELICGVLMHVLMAIAYLNIFEVSE